MRFLLIAAVLPAAFLMNYIYKKDRVDKEPGALLLVLAVMGAVCCLPAALFERIGMTLAATLVPPDTVTYAAIEAFAIVALAEEFCKHLVLKSKTWNENAFNCTFDGIVYAVFVSLGFAALENVKYAFTYGIAVLGSRAIFSIPGHMTFGVFMGLYYSRAKLAEAAGDFAASDLNQKRSLLIPILLHGFYDFCLISGLESLSVLFLLFVVLLDVRTIKVIKAESYSDRPIYPEDPFGGAGGMQ